DRSGHLRAERRAAHARLRHPGPRHGGVPQFLSDPGDARPRAVPRGKGDRVPGVRSLMNPRWTVMFRRADPLGTFCLRPADPVADAPLVHRWVTHPKAAFWQMQDATIADVTHEMEQYDSYL